MGLPLGWLPGEQEAAGSWLRGDVTVETVSTGPLVGGLIHALGMSQVDAARAWGVQPTTVQRWRRGELPPPGGLAWWGLVWWGRRALVVGS